MLVVCGEIYDDETAANKGLPSAVMRGVVEMRSAPAPAPPPSAQSSLSSGEGSKSGEGEEGAAGGGGGEDGGRGGDALMNVEDAHTSIWRKRRKKKKTKVREAKGCSKKAPPLPPPRKDLPSTKDEEAKEAKEGKERKEGKEGKEANAGNEKVEEKGEGKGTEEDATATTTTTTTTATTASAVVVPTMPALNYDDWKYRLHGIVYEQSVPSSNAAASKGESKGDDSKGGESKGEEWRETIDREKAAPFQVVWTDALAAGAGKAAATAATAAASDTTDAGAAGAAGAGAAGAADAAGERDREEKGMDDGFVSSSPSSSSLPCPVLGSVCMVRWTAGKGGMQRATGIAMEPPPAPPSPPSPHSPPPPQPVESVEFEHAETAEETDSGEAGTTAAVTTVDDDASADHPLAASAVVGKEEGDGAGNKGENTAPAPGGNGHWSTLQRRWADAGARAGGKVEEGVGGVAVADGLDDGLEGGVVAGWYRLEQTITSKEGIAITKCTGLLRVTVVAVTKGRPIHGAFAMGANEPARLGGEEKGERERETRETRRTTIHLL
jgi:hypothetical protein